ncbi:MAG: hypothetical protein GY865_20120 [candidate division Zixibacteria bacterium]|nr:hypothetical protein [candidate division Zixibacteria bacterium]
MFSSLVNLSKILFIFISIIILFLIDHSNISAQNREGIPGPTLIYPPQYGPHLTPPITMSWENIQHATKYQLQISREDPEFTSPEIDTVTIYPGYTIDTLFGAHYNFYYWHVRAQLNTSEWTDWSETWRFLSFCLVDGPRMLKPPNEIIFQSEIITLEWQGCLGSFGYDIWIDDDPVFGSPDFRLESIDPFLDVFFLLPSKTYYWKVRSWHECAARWSDVWSFTTCTPFPPPEPLNPPNGAIDVSIPVELTWNESPYSIDFQLQMSTTPEFIDPLFDTIISGQYHSIAQLEEGIIYYWRLHLLTDDPCGYENWSQVKHFTTDIPFICGDTDHDDLITILDIVFIINYKYKSGPESYPPESADVNFDSEINIMDIVYLINYIYKLGSEPVCQ